MATVPYSIAATMWPLLHLALLLGQVVDAQTNTIKSNWIEKKLNKKLTLLNEGVDERERSAVDHRHRRKFRRRRCRRHLHGSRSDG